MYVDALLDRKKDIIHVVERLNGKRKYVQYPAQYVFYYPSQNGKHTSIHGDKLARVVSNTSKKFNIEKKIHADKWLHESDTNVLFRCLSDHYAGKDAPKLNIGFFDIETAFCKKRGFAPPDDPFNSITAIAVHLNWLGKTICLTIKPPSMSEIEAQGIVAKFPDNVMLFATEELMLLAFLELIADVDVLSGWNSSAFDIPYTVNRVIRILSNEHAKKFCLWGESPNRRQFERYGKLQETYDLVGIQHLDYFDLYRKYTYQEMHSYSLDAISEHELDERKVEYDGTLDQLYNNDYEKFIRYSLQDVDLIVRLDKKLQFIDLANVIAHDNLVLLPTTMGSVAQIDQAILNEAHRKGQVVPDRERSFKDSSVAGAYVAYPKKGLHDWVGSMDLNSLYPSIIRALNMSPESLVGQIRPTYTHEYIQHKIEHEKKGLAEAWEGKFASLEYDLVMARDKVKIMHIDFSDESVIEGTGAEIYRLIFEERMPWVLSSNGTIFNSDHAGLIPGLLDRWYSERKDLQKKAKAYKAIVMGIPISKELSNKLRNID